MLQSPSERLEVNVPNPDEETLDLLRHVRGGVREIWGYVADSHPLVPSFSDQIIGAVCRGEDLIDYSEGLAHHLRNTLRKIEVIPLPSDDPSPEDRIAWSFVLRREPHERGRYPIRWEVHAGIELLGAMQERIADLEAWDSLPCGVTFG
jgi:hypothetical protein